MRERETEKARLTDIRETVWSTDTERQMGREIRRTERHIMFETEAKPTKKALRWQNTGMN